MYNLIGENVTGLAEIKIKMFFRETSIQCSAQQVRIWMNGIKFIYKFKSTDLPSQAGPLQRIIVQSSR